MSKRKGDILNVEKLKTRFNKIRKQMEELEKDEKEKISEAGSEASPSISEAESSSDEGSITSSKSDAQEVLKTKVDEQPKKDEDEKENSKNESNVDESPLNDEIEEIFGPDPTESIAYKIKFHSSFLKKWKYWFENGLEKDQREQLLKNYQPPPGLEALKLNPEIVLKLPKHSKTRDGLMEKRQHQASAALASLGWAMSTLIEEKESVDKLFLLERLFEASQLIVDMMYNQTKSRRALILAGIENDKKMVLENTKPEEYLFGKNLSEKMKEAKTMDKTANEIKKIPYKSSFKPSFKKSLNSWGLQEKHPAYNQAGQNQTYKYQAGTSRQRLEFKNRSRSYQSSQRSSHHGQNKFRGQDRPR